MRPIHPVTHSHASTTSTTSTAHKNTPTVAPKRSTTVRVSTSPVHVGSASGSWLYYEAWDVLIDQCPDPSGSEGASCHSNKVNISNIDTVLAGANTHGEISLIIQDSYYTSMGERQALLGAAINAFVYSTSDNGKNETWTEQSTEACPDKYAQADKYTQAKTDKDTQKRYVLPSCTHYTTVYTAAEDVYVELYIPGQPYTAYLNLHIAFEVEETADLWMEFTCDLAIGAISGVLDKAAPEVDTSDWDLLGVLSPCCGDSC